MIVGGVSTLQPGEVVRAQAAPIDLTDYQSSSNEEKTPNKDGMKPSQKGGN